MDKIFEEKIPITVYGTDSRGEMFVEDAQTVAVARAWVKLPLRHRLSPGAEIIIFNKANGNQAEFLLEGQEGGAFKAILKDQSIDIWEKDFGVVPEPEPELAIRVHIVCDVCGTRESVLLGDEQVDRLLDGEPLQRHCAQCVKETDWHSAVVVAQREPAQHAPRPAAVQSGPQAPPSAPRPASAPPPGAPGKAAARPAAQAPAAPPPLPSGAERRTSRRIHMKTDARIRRSSGGTEVLVPVNVSRGGIAFQSRAYYELEEVVHVALHYRKGAEPMEAPGRIVRVSKLENAFEFGVRFES